MPASATAASPADSPSPLRHPAAVARAISAAWQPSRRRAYAAGLAVGLVTGGVVAPLLTIGVARLASRQQWTLPLDGRWFPAVWTLAFVVAAPLFGARFFVRWQPAALRSAAEAYLWLAARTERTWRRVVGDLPLPEDAEGMRQTLQALPDTPQTAGERAGLWIALSALDRARDAAAMMPDGTPDERVQRVAVAWLIDFVGGATQPLAAVEEAAAAVTDPAGSREAAALIALCRARVALSEGDDWQAPLVAVRPRLGHQPRRPYRRMLWRGAFQPLLVLTLSAAGLFWIAVVLFRAR